MENINVIYITAGFSLITAIVTAIVTSKLSHKNEVKKWLLERRAELYFDLYEEVEKLLNDKTLVLDKEYLKKITSYKPKMKLLTSKDTFKSFKIYYEFLTDFTNKYEKFCNDNNPENNDELYEYITDEDGVEHCISYITNQDLVEFELKMYKYKNDIYPNKETVNSVIDPLYESMRKDLGNR